MTTANSELSACWWDQALGGGVGGGSDLWHERLGMSQSVETKLSWVPNSQKGSQGKLDTLLREPS